VTSKGLVDSFQGLVDRRISQGFQGSIVSVETIEAGYPGRDTAEKIRNWVKDTYKDGDSLFLAIGGDDAIVPVRFCCSPAKPEWRISTDLYYADVDGTWDADGDGIYGELNDICQDSLSPEIYVGRIPIRTASDARVYTEKVIKYETASPEGFSNSILYIVGPGDDLVFDGYISFIQPYWQAVPLHVFSQDSTVWDDTCCGWPLTTESLIDQISRGYHFVRYYGHSAPHTWSLYHGVFRTKHAGLVTNPVPFILWSGGCFGAVWDQNAPHGSIVDPDPTRSEAFIRNTKGGAVAVVGHNQSLGGNPHAENFFKAVFQSRELYLGRAYTRALAMSAPKVSDLGWVGVHYMFTFLGDPALHLLREETGPKLQIFAPKNGEIVSPLQEPITIRWNACGTVFEPNDRVKIEYSDDGGGSWTQVPGAEALIYNGRVFDWKQGDSLSRGVRYRLRISRVGDAAVPCAATSDFIYGTMWYVNDDVAEEGFAVGDDKNDGLTAQTPKRHIRMWLEDARCATPGVVIRVSEGTYQENLALTDLRQCSLVIAGAGKGRTIIDGGAVGSCLKLDHCGAVRMEGLSFVNGAADKGAGIYCRLTPLVLANCDVMENHTRSEGGGIYVDEGSPVVTGCQFSGNTAAEHGGALCVGDGATPFVTNSVFRENTASLLGGAVYSRNDSTPEFRNCIFAFNSATKRGGALHNVQGSNMTLVNCTLVGNRVKSSPKDGGGIYNKEDGKATLLNCILWYNTPDQINSDPDTIQVTYSDIEDSWPGEGNRQDDPLFADYDAGDFHLKSKAGRWDPAARTWVIDRTDSPCIDAGDPDSPVGDEPEPNGGRINMGAFGGTAEASKSSVQ
jgi:predicted outer membrane repeat protein